MTLVTKNKPGFMGPRDKEKLDYLSSDLDPALIAGSEPTLDLDFSAEGSVPDTVTFTRNSIGTYYDNKTVAKAEENLQTLSQLLNGWGAKGAVTVTTDATTAPDGTTTAERLTEAAITSAHYMGNRVVSATAGLAYTMSVFLKKGTLANAPDIFQISWDGSPAIASTNCVANFNLSTGTVTLTGPDLTDASITNAGNGWWRCSISFLATGTTSSTSIGLFFCNNNSTAGRGTSYLGQTTADVFAWGAQLEQRDSVTAYIPTTTQRITKYQPVLLTAPANKPRIDHDPITRECKGLLIEESRQNLIPYSEDFSNAAWAYANVSIKSNIAVAPDGTLTADSLVPSTLNTSSHYIYEGITTTSGNTYTLSVFGKAAEYSYLRLASFQDACSGVFDLNSGKLIATSGTLLSTSIIPFGNGWYRCSITYTSSTTGNNNHGFYAVESDNYIAAFSGDGYSGIFIWGAQVEEGAFPTSYIPTSGSAVTRGADNALMTGSNFSDWYRQDQGSVYVESIFSTLEGNPYFASFEENGSTRISLYENNQKAFLFVRDNNVGNAAISQGDIITSNLQKFSAAFTVNDFNLSANGTVNVGDTSGTMPTAKTLYLGIYGSSNQNYLNGHILRLTYWPKRLSNEILKRLSIK